MSVLELVDRERGRLRLIHAAGWLGLALVVTSAVVGAGAWLLAESRWIALPRATPLLVWLLLIAGNGGLAWWTRRRNRAQLARPAVAAAIEREQELRAGALRGVLEVANVSAIARRADRALADGLRDRSSLAPRLRHAGVVRAAQSFGVAAVTLALLLWAAPVLDDGLLAIRRPFAAWNGSLLPAIRFRDLPTNLLRGELLSVAIDARGRRAITLGVRSTGEGWRALRVPVDGTTGIATAQLGAISGDLTLVAMDGRSATDTMRVRVTDRPFVGGVVLRAEYPAYLGRAPEGLPIGEPARVPQGTVIDVSGRASTALSRVLLRTTMDSVPFQTAAHSFSGRFRPRRSDRWTWLAFGANSPIADVPAPLDITVVPDSAPRVELAASTDTILASTDRVTLQIVASDDHGLSRIELLTTRVAAGRGRTAPATVALRLAEGEGSVWSGTPTVSLAAHGLEAGDALRVQAVATDNSPWAQRGASREIVLRMPTMEERRELARDAADSTAQEAVATAAAQRSLEQRTDEASRERGNRVTPNNPNTARGADDPRSSRDRDMSFESAEKARALAQEQRALAERVEKLRQAAAALEQQLREASALDTSLARQLRDAQDLLRDALTPELMEQMRKLEDASRNLSGEQARDAMKNLAEMQRRLREQLEKSAEMLKRAALEGNMETLRDEARDIADQEHALADSSARRDSVPRGDPAAGADSAARRESARRLADRSDRLSNNVQRLQERLAREHADAAAGKTQSAQQHADASERSMRQQDPRAAAQQMEQAANDMRDAREQQVGAWKQELTSALDESIQEMLELAREESALEQRARSGDNDASQREDMRAQQSALQQGADKTAERLQREGRKSSLLSGRSQRAVSDAQQRVAQATRQLAEPRNQPQSANSLGDASDALNRAAAALARDRERVNGASSATGFAEMLQQMQEMAKRQGSINAQAQGLMPMPGASMSPDATATARMLARQQRAIAQQLDELGEAAGGDRAGELAKEARRLADALDQTRVDANTLARQQQLFRRLLDAGRSLERDERDDSERREAHAATGDQRFNPGQQPASGRAANRFREPDWNELRGLNADERRAILEYFKRINADKP